MKAAIALLLVLAVVPVCAGLTPMELAQLKGLRAVTAKVDIRLWSPRWPAEVQDLKNMRDNGLNKDVLRPMMSTSLRDAGLAVPDTTGSAFLVLTVLARGISGGACSYLKLSLIQAALLERDSAPASAEVAIGDALIECTGNGWAESWSTELVKAVKSFTQLQTNAFISYYEAANSAKSEK
jgi:hypothetical protein